MVNIVTKWGLADKQIHERFMVTYCPSGMLDDVEDNYEYHFNELSIIFKMARKWKIEAEFTAEYGKTDRLHFHIVVMCGTKSALHSFNRVMWYKLSRTGFIHKSPYHDYLPDYLAKEEKDKQLPYILPRHFSIETLENYAKQHTQKRIYICKLEHLKITA